MNEELSVPEAALLYGCSKSNMAYLVASGRVPSARVGKLIRIKRDDVLALREARDSRKQHNQWIEPISRGA